MEIRGGAPEKLDMSDPNDFSFNGLSGGTNNDYDNNNDDTDDAPNRTMADRLLGIINPYIVEIFEDQYNNPFVAIRVNEHIEIIPIL